MKPFPVPSAAHPADPPRGRRAMTLLIASWLALHGGSSLAADDPDAGMSGDPAAMAPDSGTDAAPGDEPAMGQDGPAGEPATADLPGGDSAMAPAGAAGEPGIAADSAVVPDAGEPTPTPAKRTATFMKPGSTNPPTRP